ncbi:MAG TPA: OmcA/MtrC family decaheme c-type cytochrome, partial [Steroidobacteraceae bacterium]|nr:OmcA/MtrC family decaheme c-type cytochrome [Steroidobacteraceae bacterium]
MSDHRGFLGALLRICALALLGAAMLSACSNGKDGATGASGAPGGTGPAGPPGPSGPILALDVSTATTITATVSGVTGASKPTIKFALADQNGQPLKGLPPNQVSFAIAQLTPVAIGSSTSSQWLSYIEHKANAVSTSPGAGNTAVQPTTESGATAGGTFVDNADGTYAYTFSKDLPTYAAASTADGVAMSYDGTLTHRVGMEFRGTVASPTNNGVYTYVPATGATTNLPLTRAISDNAECNACHARLALHGGPRIDVQYCVVCHNPGNSDPSSGNSLDMKVLAHKIHMGISMPTVVAAGSTAVAPGVGYTIWGYGGSVNNFNVVIWPQDKRNCQTCHNPSDPATPDAVNYKNIPHAAACGACHDTTDFTTGANHGVPPGIVAADKDCETCHGPASGLVVDGVSMQVDSVHAIPELEQLANFKFVVVKAEPTTDAAGANLDTTACPGTGPCLIPVGDYVRVTMKVTDGAGNALSLTTTPGFRPTDYIPGATPTTNVTAPSVTV